MISNLEKRLFSLIAFGFGAGLTIFSLLMGRTVANVISAMAGLAIMAIAYRLYRTARRRRPIGRWVKEE